MNLSELEVLNLHASGGMAEVYRARVKGDDGGEQQYAVKKILPHFTRDKEILKMFVEEARVAACLDHDNVVRVYDLCTTDAGEYFIVMEFADGKDLSDVIWEAAQKKARIPTGMALQAARDVLRALEYAWSAVDDKGVQLKLIHRDISPHNVLVTWDGRIKLTDFGIAKVQASANKTQMGIIKGKFGYMSPEQARGKPLDQRSDLFNVGVLLYESFTGDRLFAGQTDIETLELMRAARIPRLDPKLGIPPPLEAIMRKSLERDPALRPQTAAEFEDELLAAVHQSQIQLRSVEIVQTMARLFPQLAAAAPVVKSTRQLALKSQLWQNPIIQAGSKRAAPIGGPPAAPALAPAPAKLAITEPPAPRATPIDDAATALPSSTPRVKPQAAIKAGGGARSLDDRSAMSSSRPAQAQRKAVDALPDEDFEGADANATRVEMNPLKAPPPAPVRPKTAEPLPTAPEQGMPRPPKPPSLGPAPPPSLAPRPAPPSPPPLVAAKPAPAPAPPSPPKIAPAPPPTPAAPMPQAPLPPAALPPPPMRAAPPPSPAHMDPAPLPPLPPRPAPAPPPPQEAQQAWQPTPQPPPAAQPWQPVAQPPPAAQPWQPAPSPPAPQWQPAPQPPPPQQAWQPAPSPPPPAAQPWQPAPSPPPQAPAWQPSPPAWASQPPPPQAPQWQPSPPPPPPQQQQWQPAPQPPAPQWQPAPDPPAPAWQPSPPPPAPAFQPAPAPPPPAPAGAAPPRPMGLPPPPAGAAPPPPAGLPARGPVGAESDLPLPGGYSNQPASPAVAVSQAPAPVRKPLWRVKGELFAEVWLPMRVRVAGGVGASLAVFLGFGLAVLGSSIASGEGRDARTLLVRSSPPGAAVSLDDARLDGVTPLIVDVDLDDGPHTLKVALAAGAPAQRKLQLSGDDRFVIVTESLQSAGSIRVETRPAGARVLLDGRDVGASPLTLPGVATDKPHVLEARKPGYRNSTASVPVERPADHLMILALEPTKAAGRVVVSSALPATVMLDGAPWGMTSSSERECPPGKHELIVRVAELGIESRTTVDVPERGVAKYFVSFD